MTVPSSPRPALAQSGLNRRSVLKAGALAGAAVGTSTLAGHSAVAAAAAGGPSGGGGGTHGAAFLHGVASGDPMSDRVILWTRVTPTPEATPGSGLGEPVVVTWEISTDPEFSTLTRSDTVTTSADRDHTVKFDCTGLAPDTWYHYRFRVGDVVSPVGRTRTAPRDDAMPGRARFALVSCSNWEAGFFASYRHLADRDDLDAVMHVGDYTYEYGIGEYAGKGDVVHRPHDPPHDTVTLEDYRRRLAQYRTDPELQRLHARVPWYCTWDDHETANDNWLRGAENHDPATQGEWEARRDNSHQAYFEWMPIRVEVRDDAGSVYRRLRFGQLTEISMLDLRTYRDEPPSMFDGRAIDDPGRVKTGAAQFDWLADNFRTSTARWNVIGNSVMITPVLVPPLDPEVGQALQDVIGLPQDGLPYNADQWDGYAAERRRLFQVMQETGKNNFVFLTGDIHTSWACDLPAAPADYPGAGSVGVEFVTPSITSKNIDDMLGLPESSGVSHTLQEALKTVNHHIRWVDLDRHGYTIVEFTEGFAHADWFALTAKEDPNAGVYHMASWRVPHGSNFVQPAGPLA